LTGPIVHIVGQICTGFTTILCHEWPNFSISTMNRISLKH